MRAEDYRVLASLLAVHAIGLPTRLDAGWAPIQVTSRVRVSLPTAAKFAGEVGQESAGGSIWTYQTGEVRFVVAELGLVAERAKEVSPDVIVAGALELISSDGEHKGTVKSQRDILFEGWPGIEAIVTYSDGLAGVDRVYVTNRKLYALAEFYPAQAGRPRNTDEFLDSLVLTPDPGPGPQSKAGPTFTKFEPEGGGFSIGMPGKPVAEHYNDTEDPVEHGWHAQYGNRFYQVGFGVVPTGAPAGLDLVGLTRDNFIAAAKAIAGMTTVTRHGGVEFASTALTKPGVGAGRLDIALVNGKLYLISMIYPAGHAGSPDIEEYFDTFRLSLPARS